MPRISPVSIRSGRFLCPALLVACLVAAPAPSTAQPGLSVLIAQTWTNWNEAAVAHDDNTAPVGELELEHQWLDSRLRVFYTLAAGTYTTPGDWRYMTNNGGAVGRVDLSPNTRLFLGGSAWWRANGDAWESANYRGLSGNANLEHQLRPGATLRTGYVFDWRRFPDFEAMDQAEHRGFASLLVNLASRTTLVGEATAGTKSYGGGLITTTIVSPASGSGAGSGRGRGPGMVLTVRPVTEHTITLEGETIRAGQLTIFGRLAQSLADRTALQVQASWRTTFGDNPPAVITTPELFFDDGVYDDPYASNAATIRASFKHVLGNGATLEGGGTRFDKRYTGTPALDASGTPLPGLPLREDDVWRADASLWWPLLADHTGPMELGLRATYAFTRSDSNDAFYQYRSHTLGLGLAISY